MKNYNKILEAVNRGIQLALDNFDDDIQVQHVKYMDSMFSYSIFNQPIGNWDVSGIKSSSYMFFYASKFDQDLTKQNDKNLSNNTFKFSSIDLSNLPKGKRWILR